jgi:sulfur carrier protein
MNIILNGQQREVPEGTSVRSLIEQVGLGKSACAAEINQQLVPRRDHESKILIEGDRVELVSLVGGG